MHENHLSLVTVERQRKELQMKIRTIKKTNNRTTEKSTKTTEKANTITNQTEPRIPRLMTIRQVAATGILPEAALRRMVKEGTIEACYSGTKAFINFDNLCIMLSRIGKVS